MISGVLVVDKPAGPTSFGVIRAVRKRFGLRKAGHTGTLDPFATGVLVVCLGQATKLVPYLQGGAKEYQARVRLGVETDTLDPDGEVVREAAVPALSVQEVQAAAEPFLGVYDQQPPAYAALKVNGRRAYALARSGQVPALQPRSVALHSLRVLGVEGSDLSLELSCGPGFYVRALARDLGAALGLPAHVVALRRTRTGGFGLEASTPLASLEAGDAPTVLLRPADALAEWRGLSLSEDEVLAVRQGKIPQAQQGKLEEAGLCRLLDPSGELVAVAEVDAGALILKRVFNAEASSRRESDALV